MLENAIEWLSTWRLNTAQSVFASLFILLVAMLLRRLLAGLHSGQRSWQVAFRARFAGDAEHTMQELTWARWGVWWLGLLALLYANLGIWADAGVRDSAAKLFSEGYTIGSVKLVPAQLLLGLVVLIVIFLVNRWVKKLLQERWLAKVRMHGATRDAIAAVFGYFLTAIGVLIALSAAGFDFSKLALVAGALSIGIGFGLQNIVNNFVSGLILLFEQPIRAGDFIMLDGLSGTVKKIRVRSTEIETPDRETVIVPNSRLIEANVTNRMLRDPFGRVTIAVGVAYGSDTSRVREILLEIAVNHSATINLPESTIPPPEVIFANFGDSALMFELRSMIRDVSRRLQVASEMRFSIDERFREEGIVMPFPQRDLHIHTDLKQSNDLTEKPFGFEAKSAKEAAE